MWSSGIVFALLVALAIVHGAPKGASSYRETVARSPKRESSSLILGGRFGRSCFLQAGGCLGKRSMKIPQISFDEEMPFDAQEINGLPLQRLTENNNRFQNVPLLEEIAMKDSSRDDYLNYKK